MDLSISNIDYNDILNFVFVKYIPEDGCATMGFHIYKSMWIENPARFILTSPVHSNKEDDKLHFSVEIHITSVWRHRLHFNGYLKSRGLFIITSIEASTMTGGGWGNPNKWVCEKILTIPYRQTIPRW